MKLDIFASDIQQGDIIQPAGNSVIVLSINRNDTDLRLKVWTIGSCCENEIILRDDDLITLVDA